MASPQVEDGYTRIANELFEALAQIRIPGEARQVLDVIMRKSYGFHETWAEIALDYFALKTGMTRPSLCRAINKLEALNLIDKKATPTINKYRINKDYSTWRPLTKKRPPSDKKANEDLPKGKSDSDEKATHKRKNTKDTSKDKLFVETSDEFRLSALLFEEMEKNNPKAKKPNLQLWAKQVDLMIRRDNRTPAEIEMVIRWSQKDDFWHVNILSTKKLREKFDQLTLKMREKRHSLEDLPKLKARLIKARENKKWWEDQIKEFGKDADLSAKLSAAEAEIAMLRPEIKRLEGVK